MLKTSANYSLRISRYSTCFYLDQWSDDFGLLEQAKLLLLILLLEDGLGGWAVQAVVMGQVLGARAATGLVSSCYCVDVFILRLLDLLLVGASLFFVGFPLATAKQPRQGVGHHKRAHVLTFDVQIVSQSAIWRKNSI